MKKVLLIIMMVLFLSITTQVSASRTEFDTDQLCHIEGKIQSVEFKEAFRDPCLDDNSCPVGAYNSESLAHYNLKILINSVSCEPDKDGNQSAYEYQFPINSEVEFYSNKKILGNSNFEPGQIIKGDVRYFFGHSLTSYTLENSQQNDINKQTGINKKKEYALSYLPYGFIGFFIIISFIIVTLFLVRRKQAVK